MRKFKLLHALPDIDAGAIGKEADGSVHWESKSIYSIKSEEYESFRYQSYPLEFVLNNPYWFEEVKYKLPESWEELGILTCSIPFEVYSSYMALNKIKQLLSKYETYYCGTTFNYCIIFNYELKDFVIDERCNHKNLFSFKEKYQAEHFLKHHIELIKKASPLIWGVQI